MRGKENLNPDLEVLSQSIKRTVDSEREFIVKAYLGEDSFYARLDSINGTGEIHGLPQGTTKVVLSIPADKTTSKSSLDTLKRVSHFHSDLVIIAATSETPSEKDHRLLLKNGARAIMKWDIYATPEEFDSVIEQLEAPTPQR